jgi:hypothetical protein
MWLDGCLLGAGHASTLVALAVQKLRLPWTTHPGRRQYGKEAARRVDQEEAQNLVLTDAIRTTVQLGLV